ncbi:hypothetical protein CR513_55441, partial [Mucuna pruriens]
MENLGSVSQFPGRWSPIIQPTTSTMHLIRPKWKSEEKVFRQLTTNGEENKSFKTKPSKTPMTPTKMAKMKEKPGSLFRFLRLFSMSYTFKRVD